MSRAWVKRRCESSGCAVPLISGHFGFTSKSMFLFEHGRVKIGLLCTQDSVSHHPKIPAAPIPSFSPLIKLKLCHFHNYGNLDWIVDLSGTSLILTSM
jgi:hypothetical protein